MVIPANCVETGVKLGNRLAPKSITWAGFDRPDDWAMIGWAATDAAGTHSAARIVRAGGTATLTVDGLGEETEGIVWHDTRGRVWVGSKPRAGDPCCRLHTEAMSISSMARRSVSSPPRSWSVSCNATL